jgi:hypothetical protein
MGKSDSEKSPEFLHQALLLECDLLTDQSTGFELRVFNAVQRSIERAPIRWSVAKCIQVATAAPAHSVAHKPRGVVRLR